MTARVYSIDRARRVRAILRRLDAVAARGCVDPARVTDALVSLARKELEVHPLTRAEDNAPPKGAP